MKHACFTILASATALTFVIPVGQAAARSAVNAIDSAEIARNVQGKTCMTKAGAKFSFGTKGQYAYDGLWQNDGHYRVSPGFITITLHNGLERSFAVTTKSGVLFLEDTALSCAVDGGVVGSL